ncbi:hypothetical protein [Bradyrhizobium sp. JYMT SZCCT0428]|uniref:ATP-dependent DNA ligase n=1 Tax=Bradyrhizobium sp. JYMT SZCCT0428 TaxID=2807673 RepID=UPI0028A20DB7|nr:hypothetical protein [Bradyrhizobium sp. JYMT SZCCT0428]
MQFYAFDMLVTDGDDIRKLPLTMRKTNLARQLAGHVDGIFISDFERGEIGPELFRHACLMGLEGLVSKLADRPYRPARSPNWVKVKNPASPAMLRGCLLMNVWVDVDTSKQSGRRPSAGIRGDSGPRARTKDCGQLRQPLLV